MPYLDPGELARHRDRFALYRELREHAPAARLGPDGTKVVVSRYADVERIFKDPVMRVQPDAGRFPANIGTGAGALFHKLSLPDLDPPTHTRLRRLVVSALSPRTLAAMRTWVEEIISGAIDALAEIEGEFDLLDVFSKRVPAQIACRLLHAPETDAGTVLERMPALMPLLSHGPITPEELAAGDAAAEFYFEYVGAIVDAMRGRLGPADPIGAMMAAEEAGGRLDRDELIVTLVGFFIASYHTTMTAVTSAVYALLSHPDQMRLLAEDPDLAPSAWEEVLRWQAPVHFVTRYAGHDLDLHGEAVTEGTQLLLCIASANRDERRFPDPDTFDIRRTDNRHLAFTAGAHFCIGAPLARLEGDVLLRLLPRRLPGLALAGPAPEWTDSLPFPAISALAVTSGSPTRPQPR